MPTIKLTGNALVQLMDGATPQPVPVAFDAVYTEKLLAGINYTSAQTNLAIGPGSVTNPRIVMVFIYEGTMSLSWGVDGANPTVLSANPTPPPTDRPVLVMFRYNAPASTLYLTTTGPVRGEIWLFE